MIEIVYFTTRDRSNQHRTFGSVRELYRWVERNREILMDYAVVRKPEWLDIPLHYRGRG